MFALEQIEIANGKIRSGADFPRFIQELKSIGVQSFETWTFDSHTEYLGENNFSVQSESKYESLSVNESSNATDFIHFLKIHQQGETNYFEFCQHCAETGVEKWIVDLNKMTCTYFDKSGNEVLVEKVSSVE